MREILFTLFFLSYCIKTLPAQEIDKRIDSLNFLIEHAGNLSASARLAARINRQALEKRDTKIIVWSSNAMARVALDACKFDQVLKIGISAKEANIRFGNADYTAHLFALIGGSYTSLGFYEPGRNILYQSISYAKRIENKEQRHYRLGTVYSFIANNFKATNQQSDSSLYYFKMSYDEYNKISAIPRYLVGLRMAENNMASCYIDTKQYESAKKFLITSGIDDRENNKIDMLKFSNLATLYYQTKEYQKAITTFHQALFLAKKTENLYIEKYACKGLSEIYSILRNQKLEGLYLEKYTVLSDSLAALEKLAINAPLKSLLKEKDADHQSKIGNYKLVLLIVAPLLAIAFYLILTIYIKNKNQIINIEQMKEKSLALENEVISEIKDEQQELKRIVNLAICNDPSFFMLFNKFDQLFTDKILNIAPHMVASELEFCALLRLNFETKEIARYTGHSVRAVESKKYRIRKKLKVSSDIDLNIWMTKL